MLVGFAELDLKCADSSACPAAESLPAGALMVPPNPPGLKLGTAIASAPNAITPMASGIAGLRTILAATRPQRPALPLPALVLLGQKALRPKTARSAGSRVRPASS